jgi:MoxR-like ATPase
MTNPFESTNTVKASLSTQNYIASDEIATIVYLAQKLGKPLLAEGPAGVGKTELAKAVAGATGYELIRLQCYEGLDESKALYEWEYSKQLLYTQLLRDKLNDAWAGQIPWQRLPTGSPAKRMFSSQTVSCSSARCCVPF